MCSSKNTSVETQPGSNAGLSPHPGADPGLFSILMMTHGPLSTFDSAGGRDQTNTETGRRCRGSRQRDSQGEDDGEEQSLHVVLNVVVQLVANRSGSVCFVRSRLKMGEVKLASLGCLIHAEFELQPCSELKSHSLHMKLHFPSIHLFI